jgi:hypothetical protein
MEVNTKEIGFKTSKKVMEFSHLMMVQSMMAHLRKIEWLIG